MNLFGPTLKRILQGRALPHPLHPFLVHIPIGMWIGSFIFDAIAFATRDDASGAMFSRMAKYCMAVACVGAVPAVITGSAEFQDTPAGSAVRRLAQTHASLNAIIFLSYVSQFLARRQLPHTSIGALFGNLCNILLLSVSGMIGHKMVSVYKMGTRPFRPSLLEKGTDALASATDPALRAVMDKMASGSATARSPEVGMGG